MTTDVLERIILVSGEERKLLIQKFQEDIWNDRIEAENEVLEVLRDLALDLDYYEPNEFFRREDYSYFGDSKLKEEIESVIQRLEFLTKPSVNPSEAEE